MICLADAIREQREAYKARRRDVVGFSIVENLAMWRGIKVTMTGAEVNVIIALIDNAPYPVPYRDLYDAVHYVGYNSGPTKGPTPALGYRVNTRAIVKRMRMKLPDFNLIENISGFGYRWKS